MKMMMYGPILTVNMMMKCEVNNRRQQLMRTTTITSSRSRPSSCYRRQCHNAAKFSWSTGLLLLQLLFLAAFDTQQQQHLQLQNVVVVVVDALATPSSIRRRPGKTAMTRKKGRSRNSSSSSSNGSRSDPSSASSSSSVGGNGFGGKFNNKNDGIDDDENITHSSSRRKDSYEGDISGRTTTAATTRSRGGDEIYSLPALYDMAFGYRNYDEEVEFLFEQHSILQQQQQRRQQQQTQKDIDDDDVSSQSTVAFFPRRVLELAAGPARHSLEALMMMMMMDDNENRMSSESDGDKEEESGRVTAIDISPSMKDYGLELASTELDVDTQQRFDYRLGDITDFDLCGFKEKEEEEDGEEPNDNPSSSKTPLYDTAWLLLGSLQHLTTNDEVIRCFQCVNRHLRPGGTLVLELPHPRELFSLVECTRNGWEIPLEGEDGETIGELKIVWGDDHDEFDPVTQIRQFTVAMELTGPEEEEDGGGGEQNQKKKPKDKTVVLQSVKEIVPMRHFTAQEIDCLAKLSGFEVKAKFGALDSDVDIDSDEEAFRLVCVLQKP